MRFFERVRADIASLRGFSRALSAVRPIARTLTGTFPALIDKLAARHGDRPALLSERESFTYRGLADRMNRYARWALTHGVEKGDVVCLLMPNRPDYVAIWLGITRVGGVAALVNTNLVGQSLAACIDSVAPKHVIAAGELSAQIVGAEPYLKTKPRLWIKGEGPSQLPCIDSDVDHLPGGPLDGKEIRGVTLSDPALYIFTAGTTGLSKAAIIDHQRLMRAVLGFAGVLDAQPTDRMFDCLPMYHMLGGVLAIGPLLVRGGSVVIREKFTAISGATCAAPTARSCNMSAKFPRPCCALRRTRRRVSITCACAAAPGCGPRFGASSRRVSASRTFSNSMHRAKAM
jgi:fatty-acyl-CoA synthase